MKSGSFLKSTPQTKTQPIKKKEDCKTVFKYTIYSHIYSLVGTESFGVNAVVPEAKNRRVDSSEIDSWPK